MEGEMQSFIDEKEKNIGSLMRETDRMMRKRLGKS
jgi:hypothetical protein